MIQDTFVIDGVAHAFDFSASNRAETIDPETYERIGVFGYKQLHTALESLEPNYLLSVEEFTARWNAEDLAHTFFVESDVDMVVHHSVYIGQ